MNDLEMATTSELLEELARRHDLCAFIGRPIVADCNPGLDTTHYAMKGDALAVVGIIAILDRMAVDLVAQMVDQGTDTEQETEE